MLEKSDKYNDIINLPHHVSEKHARMSLEERSAQFAPFSALTGYDEVIKETARKINNNERNSFLTFKFSHKFHLMFVNILYWKCVSSTFFSVKTYWYSLYNPNIIHSTFLVKICQSNMSCLLVNIDRLNRGWNFLYKSQM